MRPKYLNILQEKAEPQVVTSCSQAIWFLVLGIKLGSYLISKDVF